jgi:hypothetical protein
MRRETDDMSALSMEVSPKICDNDIDEFDWPYYLCAAGSLGRQKEWTL